VSVEKKPEFFRAEKGGRSSAEAFNRFPVRDDRRSVSFVSSSLPRHLNPVRARGTGTGDKERKESRDRRDIRKRKYRQELVTRTQSDNGP
jgi:hypothetical protein